MRGAIEQVLDEAFIEDSEKVQAFLASYSSSGSQTARADSASLQNDLAALVYRIRSYGCEPALRDFAPPVQELSSALKELAGLKGLDDLAELAGQLDGVSPGDTDSLWALLRERAWPVRKSARPARRRPWSARFGTTCFPRA